MMHRVYSGTSSSTFGRQHSWGSQTVGHSRQAWHKRLSVSFITAHLTWHELGCRGVSVLFAGRRQDTIVQGVTFDGLNSVHTKPVLPSLTPLLLFDRSVEMVTV